MSDNTSISLAVRRDMEKRIRLGSSSCLSLITKQHNHRHQQLSFQQDSLSTASTTHDDMDMTASTTVDKTPSLRHWRMHITPGFNYIMPPGGASALIHNNNSYTFDGFSILLPSSDFMDVSDSLPALNMKRYGFDYTITFHQCKVEEGMDITLLSYIHRYLLGRVLNISDREDYNSTASIASIGPSDTSLVGNDGPGLPALYPRFINRRDGTMLSLRDLKDCLTRIQQQQCQTIRFRHGDIVFVETAKCFSDGSDPVELRYVGKKSVHVALRVDAVLHDTSSNSTTLAQGLLGSFASGTVKGATLHTLEASSPAAQRFRMRGSGSPLIVHYPHLHGSFRIRFSEPIFALASECRYSGVRGDIAIHAVLMNAVLQHIGSIRRLASWWHAAAILKPLPQFSDDHYVEMWLPLQPELKSNLASSLSVLKVAVTLDNFDLASSNDGRFSNKTMHRIMSAVGYDDIITGNVVVANSKEPSTIENVDEERIKKRQLLGLIMNATTANKKGSAEVSLIAPSVTHTRRKLMSIGNSVLAALISIRLYSLLPNASPGHLTHIRESLCRRSNLNRIANYWGIQNVLLSSCSEISDIDLAGTLKSIIGWLVFLTSDMKNSDRGPLQWSDVVRFVDNIFHFTAVLSKMTIVLKQLSIDRRMHSLSAICGDDNICSFHQYDNNSMGFDSRGQQLLFGMRHPCLLRAALAHPNLTLNSTNADENQRLEWLGDAILRVCASLRVVTWFSEAEHSTEFISKLLTSNIILAEAAKLSWIVPVRSEHAKKRQKLNGNNTEIVFLEVDEENDYSYTDTMLADVFESLVAVLFIDKSITLGTEAENFFALSLERVLSFFDRAVMGNIEALLPSLHTLALKDVLQSTWAHSDNYDSSNPVYDRFFDKEKKQWYCSVILGKDIFHGFGHSKRTSEDAAAREAMNHLHSQ